MMHPTNTLPVLETKPALLTFGQRPTRDPYTVAYRQSDMRAGHLLTNMQPATLNSLFGIPLSPLMHILDVIDADDQETDARKAYDKAREKYQAEEGIYIRALDTWKGSWMREPVRPKRPYIELADIYRELKEKLPKETPTEKDFSGERNTVYKLRLHLLKTQLVLLRTAGLIDYLKMNETETGFYQKGLPERIRLTPLGEHFLEYCHNGHETGILDETYLLDLTG